MRNAMDSQEIAVGWWPGDARYPKAAFYAYAYPAPPGFSGLSVSPAAAHWDPALGEYILDWDDIRSEPRTRTPRLWSSPGRPSARPAWPAPGTATWPPPRRARHLRSGDKCHVRFGKNLELSERNVALRL